MHMTPKQLKFLCVFYTHVAPRLDMEPSHPDTPGLLREAAALLELYLVQGKDAFRAKADELLQNKPRGVKVIDLAMELAMAASFMGDDLSEAARHALWLADEFESSFTNKQEK